MTHDEIMAIDRRVAELAGIEIRDWVRPYCDPALEVVAGPLFQFWAPWTDVSQALLALERYCELRRCSVRIERWISILRYHVELIPIDDGQTASASDPNLSEAICRAMDAAGGEG